MIDDSAHDTVLIVDDEYSFRFALQRMLADEGCHVVAAGDGTEAQEILQSHADVISVVILDWMMPQMTGIELLRWMKSQHTIEHIPVIMLTALDDPERVKEGIDAGAFYYLVKPFQRPLLNSILRAAAADYHNTRQLLDRLRRHERPLAFLDEATYRVRTLEEAQELAVVIASATPDPEHAMVISELITNAIEHGNLGITYEEKGKLLDQDQWEQEVERRIAMPENSKKQVVVRIKKVQDVLRVEIEDEGKGFDYSRYLRIDESRLFDNHGRGIAIAAATLNLRFAGPGNKVIVTLPMAGAARTGAH
jgi:DNA-binding response OmpR family regulator